eukprot:357277-Chlamydomonas_euryale.AAC.1
MQTKLSTPLTASPALWVHGLTSHLQRRWAARKHARPRSACEASKVDCHVDAVCRDPSRQLTVVERGYVGDAVLAFGFDLGGAVWIQFGPLSGRLVADGAGWIGFGFGAGGLDLDQGQAGWIWI